MSIWESNGSGTLLVKDGVIFLVSSLFQAQSPDADEIIENLLTRSVPDPFNLKIDTSLTRCVSRGHLMSCNKTEGSILAS
jgi:hypothetical protein